MTGDKLSRDLFVYRSPKEVTHLLNGKSRKFPGYARAWIGKPAVDSKDYRIMSHLAATSLDRHIERFGVEAQLVTVSILRDGSYKAASISLDGKNRHVIKMPA